ncbi:MAG: AraC family transcriptional regulator [Bacteroidales bacterium]|nr:AraC family transcriptional regulator [Bacteroidales bacterium]
MTSIQDIDSRLILSDRHREVYIHDGLILNPRVSAEQEVGRTVLQGQPYRVREHRIVRVTKGCISLRINLREFDIEAGTLIYVKAGSVMEIISFHPQTEALLMGFSDGPSTSSFKGYVTLKKVSPQMDMLLDLIESAAMEEPYLKDYAGHLVSALYSFVTSGDFDCKQSSGNRKEDLFNRFLTLVENTQQKQQIPYYAEKLHIDPHYLSRVVSEVSGVSVMEWIRRNLILQAKVMLRTSDKSVLGISEELGFATLPFFCRFFKNATGSTPTEYRRISQADTDLSD